MSTFEELLETTRVQGKYVHLTRHHIPKPGLINRLFNQTIEISEAGETHLYDSLRLSAEPEGPNIAWQEKITEEEVRLNLLKILVYTHTPRYAERSDIPTFLLIVDGGCQSIEFAAENCSFEISHTDHQADVVIIKTTTIRMERRPEVQYSAIIRTASEEQLTQLMQLMPKKKVVVAATE